MKLFLTLLIATSLTANAWLAFRAPPAEAADTARTVAAQVARPGAVRHVSGDFPVAALEAADPADLRDRLRAAGADEALVRAMVEGWLRRRYGEQLTALRRERARAAWWRSDARTAAGEDARLLQETVTAPLRALLGRDPLDLRDAENRYLFLPPAKRRLLAEIALDYADLEAAAGGRWSGNALKAEIDQQNLLAEERRKDVLAALTPVERAEYNLRFEGAAGLLSGRLAAMNGTEREFRALRPVLDEHRRLAGALPQDDGFSAAFTELQQRTVNEMSAAIGPERTLDYLWSGPGVYPELVRFARENGLPATTAARVLQLAADTGVRASAIHHDAAIPAEQKGAALQALQTTVRAEFDALVPGSLRAGLPEQASIWFTMLGEGRYMGFTPTLDSTGSGTIAPIAIAAPSAGKAWSPSPRPPAR